MLKNLNIINYPEDADNYEFVVITPTTSGEMLYIGSFTNGLAAERSALACQGVVIHNVRINGYKAPPKHKYSFKGTWFWECEATSREAAIDKFENECCPEELEIAPYDDIYET